MGGNTQAQVGSHLEVQLPLHAFLTLIKIKEKTLLLAVLNVLTGSESPVPNRHNLDFYGHKQVYSLSWHLLPLQ